MCAVTIRTISAAVITQKNGIKLWLWSASSVQLRDMLIYVVLVCTPNTESDHGHKTADAVTDKDS